jgi:hypothetical protein
MRPSSKRELELFPRDVFIALHYRSYIGDLSCGSSVCSPPPGSRDYIELLSPGGDCSKFVINFVLRGRSV